LIEAGENQRGEEKIGHTEAHEPIRLKAKGVHLLGTELMFLLSHASDSNKEKEKQ
jgi:hypothetical protein